MVELRQVVVVQGVHVAPPLLLVQFSWTGVSAAFPLVPPLCDLTLPKTASPAVAPWTMDRTSAIGGTIFRPCNSADRLVMCQGSRPQVSRDGVGTMV